MSNDMELTMANPPEDKRDKELWLQNAAGFILFRDMRSYALDRIPADISTNTREQIIKSIDDTIYGLMMMMDGVSGTLRNDDYLVSIESKIILQKRGVTIQEVNTLEGDGMCMGFHSWKENDFGEDAIIKSNN